MKKMGFCLVFFFLLVVSTPGFSNSDVNAILTQATILHDKAVANEGGWIITTTFIEDANKLLAKGNGKKALEAANKAIEYAELSVKQAETENRNWSEPPYLK